MSTWDACTMEPNHWLRWIECHPGLAGYIQAVGVVATLVAALLGPPLARWIGRLRERAARAAATISLAKGLLLSVNTLIERIDGRLATVDTYDEPDGQDWRLFLNNMMIEIPGAMDMLLYPGEVFDAQRLAFLQRLLEQGRGYNMRLSAMTQQELQEGGWTALQDQVRSALCDLRQSAAAARGTIDGM